MAEGVGQPAATSGGLRDTDGETLRPAATQLADVERLRRKGGSTRVEPPQLLERSFLRLVDVQSLLEATDRLI